MILLTSIGDLVELTCGASVASIDIHCSYVDINGSTITPGRTNTIITSSTALTTIVGSPASSTQRNVKFISVNNTSATSCQVKVQHTDGSNVITLCNPILQPSYTLFYNDLAGWGQMDNNGSILDTPLQGRLLNTTLLTTTTSANFTTGASTNTIRVRMVGGGAGGGGCNTSSSTASVGGGGGAGGYAEVLFSVLPNTAYAYQCGAAGSGVSASTGGAGSNTTFTGPGSVTVTALGGSGGLASAASSAVLSVAGGAGGTVSTNGSLDGAGLPGDFGLILSATIFASGAGGSTVFGGGGVGVVAASAGIAAAGYGSGGGGAATTSTAHAGGGGTQGCIIVDEYS